jgi:hypothetical protein
MKTKKSVCVCICLLFFAPILLAEDYKKEVSVEAAMKAFCGMWSQEAGGDCLKKIWNQDGTFAWYCYGNEKAPVFQGTFKIEKAWLDSDGNTWCIVWRSYRGNSWALTQISGDGNVQERVVRLNRADFHRDTFIELAWSFEHRNPSTRFYPIGGQMLREIFNTLSDRLAIC